MRLIVKEYILQLKEKDELDTLLSQIFEEKGYAAVSQPRTGNRQYGVDIQLHNKEELIFLVIKQGDIDRKVWDGDTNAVRQSLDEIKDVMINNLTLRDRSKRIRIVVASNGHLDESVKLNWNNYVNNNRVWGDLSIEIGFMGIDDIVQEVLGCFFNEYLFDKKLHSLLRKALYFIDESTYRRWYYEKIVNSIMENIEKAGGDRKRFYKLCATLYLSSQMIAQYAYQEGITRIGIMVSEYVLIRYWKYLAGSQSLEKGKNVEWLIKFCHSYEKWNDLYWEKAEQVACGDVILPNYNVAENRVLLYELLGNLASYANYLLDFNFQKSMRILNTIVHIMNQYSYYVYPPYDSSIGVMIMIYRLLNKNGCIDELKLVMKEQCHTLMNYYRLYQRYPAQTDSFDEAVAIEMNNTSEKYEVSGFWGYCLLLIYRFDDKELYDMLRDFLAEDLKDVCKCVWFLRSAEEELFYEPGAMNLAGEGVEVTVEDNYPDFCRKVGFILDQYKEERFTFDEYSFSGLETIICHYYEYVPRV